MSARDDAIEKLAKVADDWGWKGGKPGEVTGTNVVMQMSLPKSPSRDQKLAQLTYRMYEQLEKTKNPVIRDEVMRIWESYGMNAAARDFAKKFYTLEKADIPREWTGKVLAALDNSLDKSGLEYNRLLGYKYNRSADGLAKGISDLMRPMTNDQREAFLNLLPRWTGSLETAASAAKKLYRR